MMKRIVTNCLDAFADALAANQLARRSFNRIANRMNGLLFDSYDVNDEAALALSFAQGGALVDGGANQGDYTLALLDAGKDRFGKVLMVEPNPFHEPKLNAIMCSNPPGHVIFECAALGAEQGRMTLHFDREGSALASLYARDLTFHGVSMDHQMEVAVETLDNLALRHGLDRIDFLKLDLEGHELPALRGAVRMLGNHAIRAIVFEFGGTNLDSRVFLRDFWSFLGGNYGFALYRILPRRRLLRLERNDERDERFSWQNLLACAPGVRPAWPVIQSS